MKRRNSATLILGMLCSLLFLSCTGRTVIKSPALQALENVLPSYEKDPGAGPIAGKVRANITKYQELQDRAFQNTDDLELTVIFMIHNNLSQDPDMSHYAEISQGMVKERLESLGPDVIGNEGTFSDQFNADTREQDMLAIIHDIGMPPPEKKAPIEDKSGVWAYMQGHPDAIVIGVEDRDLLGLDFMTEGIVTFTTNLSFHTRYLILRQLMTPVRTEIALAKLISKLRAVNRTRGVLVEGGAHEPSMKELCQRLNLHVEIYEAAPQE